MTADVSPTYAFGPFRLEVGERRLLCEGRAAPLRTKVFDTLRALGEQATGQRYIETVPRRISLRG